MSQVKKIETSTVEKKNYRHPQTAKNRAPKTQFMPNVQAQPFVPTKQNDNDKVFLQTLKKIVVPTCHRRTHSRTMLFNRSIQLMHLSAIITKHPLQSTHVQRTLRIFFKLAGRSKLATLASGDITETRHDYAEATLPMLSPSKLFYVADKRNKCKYLIDTGAAVSVFPKSLTGLQTLSGCPSFHLIIVLSIPMVLVNA